MNDPDAPNYRVILEKLVSRTDLSGTEIAPIFNQILSAAFDEAQVSAFLVAMRQKGETATELSAAAIVLRKYMLNIDLGRDDLLDTCGTGGDGSGTFNISTAAAIVAAGADVPVVKHGNRAVTSRTGSADVLGSLGIQVESGIDWVKRCFDEAGMAFCFAPQFHPGLKHVASLRRRLGVRTMLNLLGPLVNPANAAYQLLGVGSPDLLDPIAGALATLGIRRAFVVCGRDGLDEVSLSAPTLVREVHEGVCTPMEWNAADFGLQEVTPDSLQAKDSAHSAQIITDILSGAESPASRVTIANAAAAVVVTGRARSLKEGADIARTAIRSGSALRVLERLQQVQSQN